MAAASNYQRKTTATATYYNIQAADIGGMMGTERGIALFRSLFFCFVGFIIIMVAAGSLADSSSVLALLIIILYFVACFFYVRMSMRRLQLKATTVFGARGHSNITLSASGIVVENTGVISVPLQDVRRVKIANTLDKNLDVQSRDLGNLAVAVAQPTWTRTGVLLGTQAIGQARTSKAKQICFAVFIDHGNNSTSLADGLDELTALNFYEDFSRDFAQMVQGPPTVRSVG